MPFEIDLKGKNVLVTGGGRGLGIDIARSLAEAGANIALTYNASPADKIAKQLEEEFGGIKVGSYKMPADDSKAIDEAVKLITKDLGELDVVIANAGICIHQDAEKMTDKEFEDVFKVNTFGPYYLARAGSSVAYPARRCNTYQSWFPTGNEEPKDKVILFVSSISGLITNTPQNQCAYNGSKAALTHLGRSLAGEWVSKGVRVNTLSPGYISTEMSEGSESGKKNAAEWRERTPMKRFAKPKEIADMLVVLASGRSSYMTGSDVVVDGGCKL
ncbi:BZ3500_MvSof-1268-A1-R1_Chr1-3g02046 [Microbotryum saponariae]|uniref:BZ3500_MvSof-1268-A1-R1_Chr1-3g02046 protein n=1 Tax=Microbotryum saponariae TaxID=289078 RepID=A0A2X0KNA3_9BASI|nr:BZ3500_MvSof-1268-A1-R1_Chr1-3g02046 [Microbotryum saponariae]SCZ95249.1 BZ3501_MvSof-1269-A2-R1_Chr1-3g01648 [Microbotryum saponariae]